jgi:hypothetical protein
VSCFFHVAQECPPPDYVVVEVGSGGEDWSTSLLLVDSSRRYRLSDERDSERARERESVCVCVRERERERERDCESYLYYGGFWAVCRPGFPTRVSGAQAFLEMCKTHSKPDRGTWHNCQHFQISSYQPDSAARANSVR